MSRTLGNGLETAGSVQAKTNVCGSTWGEASWKIVGRRGLEQASGAKLGRASVEGGSLENLRTMTAAWGRPVGTTVSNCNSGPQPVSLGRRIRRRARSASGGGRGRCFTTEIGRRRHARSSAARDRRICHHRGDRRARKMDAPRVRKSVGFKRSVEFTKSGAGEIQRRPSGGLQTGLLCSAAEGWCSSTSVKSIKR